MNEIFNVLTTHHEVLKYYPELVINLLNGRYTIERSNIKAVEIYNIIDQHKTNIRCDKEVLYHVTYRSGWWRHGISLVPSYYNNLYGYPAIQIEI